MKRLLRRRRRFTPEQRDALELAMVVMRGYIRRLPEPCKAEAEESYQTLWKIWAES